MIDVIHQTATRILVQSPDAVVRLRLLRDVLGKAPDVQQAKTSLPHSRWVQLLADEQWADGSWGRFHSRNTQLKQKIVTTEFGVERARALGLDAEHPILQKASAYILSVMQGDIAFPDAPEYNDRWETGVRMFLAATLSRISPAHPVLDADRTLWHEIAERTFQSGTYNAQDEIDAHAELTGATVKDSYLRLDGRYQLEILGSIPGLLSQDLELALLTWLWEKPDGINYLGVPLRVPQFTKPGACDRWLAPHELLARLFPTWVRFSQLAIEWLWEQRDELGYWNLGPKLSTSAYFPLSNDWRRKQNRVFNWTTRVLILLKKYEEDSNI